MSKRQKPDPNSVARLAKTTRDRFRRDLKTLIAAIILDAAAAGAMLADVRFEHFPPAWATIDDLATAATVACALAIVAAAVNLIAILKFTCDFNDYLMPMLCDLAEVHRSQTDEIARSIEQSIRDETADTTSYEWMDVGKVYDDQAGARPDASAEADSEA